MSALRKLRSQQGASILLAMVAFLICAMVAASIIAAASANAQKTGGVRASEQSYLTVTSAARLLSDDLIQTGYHAKGSVKGVLHTCAYPASHGSTVATTASFELTDASGVSSSTPLATLLREGVSQINPNNPNSRYTRSFSVQVPGFSDVKAEFTMFGGDGEHDAYDIEIVLRNSVEATPAAVMMTAKASRSTVVTSSVEIGSDEHYDQWRFSPAYEQQAALDASWANAHTPALDTASGNYVQRTSEFGSAIATVTPIREVESSEEIVWGKPNISKGQVE